MNCENCGSNADLTTVKLLTEKQKRQYENSPPMPLAEARLCALCEVLLKEILNEFPRLKEDIHSIDDLWALMHSPRIPATFKRCGHPDSLAGDEYQVDCFCGDAHTYFATGLPQVVKPPCGISENFLLVEQVGRTAASVRRHNQAD